MTSVTRHPVPRHPPSAPHSHTGEPTLLAEVPFRLTGADCPLLLVPASVNDRGPYEFVLDTGAGMSLLSPRLADGLGIAANGVREGAGAGGRVTVAMGRVESLAVGAARGQSMAVAITAEVDRIGRAVGERIDGNLGYDFLRSFRMTLDYRRRILRLVLGGTGADAVEGAATDGIPFRLAAPVKPLILLPVFVNGAGPHTFVLDTGASVSVISSALAAALRIEAAATDSRTGAGGVLQAAVGRATKLSVGDAELRDVTVVVADFLAEIGRIAGTPLDGILGYSFLRHFSVTVDYPAARLWLVKSP